MADLAVKAKAQDINLVTRFESDLHNLLAVLNKTDVEVMAPGSAYKIYKVSGSLSTATVAEKAEIPDSGYEMGDATTIELTYTKYRNLASIEEIGKKGYDMAVGKTGESMLRDIQKGIRSTIFTAIATGTGTATGTDFQSQVAAAAAYIAEKFEDEACTPVFFANPADVYDYLGSHSVTLEQNFGLSYLENFMGIGNVIVDSNVAEGSVYGTATENLSVVAASVASIPGMELQVDRSGIIGVHTGAKYENGAIQTVAYSGLSVQPIYEDRIVIATTSA